MTEERTPLHIVTERDVGLFSLIQQVIAHIPWAVAENRTPVAYFGDRTCYSTPNGHRGKHTVWEYYFQPLDPDYPAARIPEQIKAFIAKNPPSPYQVGYPVGEHAFVSSHFGDHPALRGLTLQIPYQWDDPSVLLRTEAKAILDKFVRPRSYILHTVKEFFARHMAGHYVVGVHARGTDATSMQEVRAFRQGSLVLSRYCAEIERILAIQPKATILVATDEQSSLDHLTAAFGNRVIAYDCARHQRGKPAGRGPTGWLMPAYIAASRDVAAKNGEDAVVEYLLLSQCDYLVHNGSSLARTVLLNAPEMPHTNTHRKPPAVVQPPVPVKRDGRSQVGASP